MCGRGGGRLPRPLPQGEWKGLRGCGRVPLFCRSDEPCIPISSSGRGVVRRAVCGADAGAGAGLAGDPGQLRTRLIAAPTGSGKTLAAFLAAIDGLVRQGLEGSLADATQVVYVSPLKALSNDIQRNLEEPLAGIRAALHERGLPDVEIRTWVRTGDTPSGERERMRRRPPHILVTTPESLYILLGSASGPRDAGDARARSSSTKSTPWRRTSAARIWRCRWSACSACAATGCVRIGLSATQNPIDADRASAGPAPPPADVTIVDTGHQRPRELALEVPDSPLEAVMSAEVWQQVYDRLARLIEAHRTTLVFVNTRRMAERVARQLSDRLGEEAVTAHHGSMAKEQRLAAEQRLKRGELKALVATASLELGIDIGDVDLVCQLGSPRSIASFLQRVGRSGHAVGGTAEGTPVPAVARRSGGMRGAARQRAPRRTRSADASRSSRWTCWRSRSSPRSAAQDWPEAELYDRLRRAWPYRDAVARRFRCRRPHAGRGLRHQPWAARHAGPPRCDQPHAARPAWRAADRTDLGRHDPRQRRLPGAAGTGEPDHRHRQRGLRRRKPRRRHIPARQQRLSHHAGRARHRAGGGCARPAADDSVLARRGARSQRRTLRVGVAPARGHRHAAAARCVRR